MKYYVSGVDPEGGPYCAPDHGARRRLTLPDTYHLVELAPSESLWRGYQACLRLREAMESGEISSRKLEAAKLWARADHERERALAAALAFLGGRRLEEAEEIFAEYYCEELSRPEAWAALAWVVSDSEAVIHGDLKNIDQIIHKSWRNTRPGPILARDPQIRRRDR